jgi:membrane protein
LKINSVFKWLLRWIVRAVSSTIKGILDPELHRAAGAMAFDLFLGLIPLVALAGYFSSFLIRTGWLIVPEVRLLDFAPAPAAEVAHAQYDRLKDSGSSLAPLALVGFAWLASGSSHVAMVTVRSLLGLPRRPYFYGRFLALLVTLGGLVCASASSLGVIAMDRFFRLGVVTSHQAAIYKLMIAIGTLLVMWFAVAGLYRASAGRKQGGRSVFPGATLAVIMFSLTSYGFSTYVSKLGKYTAFYGGLAAVATMLLWLWLSSLSLLVGAEFNVRLDEQDGSLDSIFPPSLPSPSTRKSRLPAPPPNSPPAIELEPDLPSMKIEIESELPSMKSPSKTIH